MKPGQTVFSEFLYVVCSEILADGAGVVFSLAPRRIDSDIACIIQPHEYPYVIVESVVAYDLGEFWTEKTFQNQRFLAAIETPDVEEELLRRIQSGAESSEASDKIKNIMKAIVGKIPRVS